MRETREHFLFVCPRLQAVRDEFTTSIPVLASYCPLGLAERLAVLLRVSRGPDAPPADEQAQLRVVGLFLASLVRVRARHVGTPLSASLLPYV